MPRLRNFRHELAAQHLAHGKSRQAAYVAAGYKHNRGNANRLAQLPEIVERVAELKKNAAETLDLLPLDRGRILIELARLACVGPHFQEEPRDRDALQIQIRLGDERSHFIRLHVSDDRGFLTALLRNGSAAKAGMDLNRCFPDDRDQLELVLRGLLADRVIEDGRVGPSLLPAMAAVCEQTQPHLESSAASDHQAAL